MTVSRLRDIPGIGVDVIGDAADAAADPDILRLENLDTDLRPPRVAVELTRAAVDDDAANSYLPFQGHRALREAAAAHVSRLAGRRYDPGEECVIVAGGLNGILKALLATVEPGQEVVLTDPVYAGLVNRVRLAGGIPRFVPAAAVKGAATCPNPAAPVRSVTLLYDAGRLWADITAEVPVAAYPPGQEPDPGRVAGVDLGIIHPYAVAGPDAQGLLVSGRAIRAEHHQHHADTKARSRAVARRAPKPGQAGPQRWRQRRPTARTP
jgi:hypothetical protein